MKVLGVKYDDFLELDFCEQQKLIKDCHDKNKLKSENSNLEKDRIIVVSEGYSSFFKLGVTPEEDLKRVDDSLDDLVYRKPVSFVKKISRRNNNRN